MDKQEMARLNVSILGISEMKWTVMGNLIQMTIISTTVGKNPFEEWNSSHSQQEVQNAVLECDLKNGE